MGWPWAAAAVVQGRGKGVVNLHKNGGGNNGVKRGKMGGIFTLFNLSYKANNCNEKGWNWGWCKAGYTWS